MATTNRATSVQVISSAGRGPAREQTLPRLPSWSLYGAATGPMFVRTPNGEALLSECIADQAALHGVLAKVRDLNLQLISVTSVQTDHQEGSGDRGEER